KDFRRSHRCGNAPLARACRLKRSGADWLLSFSEGAMQHSEHSDKIDSALRDLIAERGWSGVSMAELADRAGIDLATLYDAAANRTRALIDAFARIDHQVLAAGAADAADTPRDRLFEIMMRRYDALVPWRGALKRLVRELPFDPPSLLAVNL